MQHQQELAVRDAQLSAAQDMCLRLRAQLEASAKAGLVCVAFVTILVAPPFARC